jgi:NAD(P)-dependent dehydrogenase (short-subunit alcohol dehydrogenase family)
MSIQFNSAHWALILGGSSGMGLATAKKLARHGMNVAVVHRDRRGAMARVDAELSEVRSAMTGFLAYNVDATTEEGREHVLGDMSARLPAEQKVRLLLHSVAFGNLKPLAPPEPCGEDPNVLGREDFERTVQCMGLGLAEWTYHVHRRGLFASDARVIGLTSEGSSRAIPGYAAVSAAKAALEAVARSIAIEYAPRGLRCNVIQAGVTDTPALRLIPNAEGMMASARARNPFARLTTPSDVADVVALLCTDEARWVNGALLRVDGGEYIVG